MLLIHRQTGHVLWTLITEESRNTAAQSAKLQVNLRMAPGFTTNSQTRSRTLEWFYLPLDPSLLLVPLVLLVLDHPGNTIK